MLRVDYVSPDGKLIKTYNLKDGLTLEEAAKKICPETDGMFPVPTLAIVGSRPAVKKCGDWQVRLDNASIQFRQIPMGGGGGGGSNPLQMVMQVAIIALAAVASIYFPPAIGLVAGTWGATLVGGLAGAAVMMLGTMLMGALFQQKLPQGHFGAMNAEQASPTYSINSTGNQARLYQTEPEIFGRIKSVPDFVANTWTQFVGNDQIGYFVYGIGRGHYEIESLAFGETVFWKNGSFVESGYTNSGSTQTLWYNQELTNGAGYASPLLCQGSSQEIKKITITLNFPEGLCGYRTYTENEPDENGDHYVKYTEYKSRTASISLQYQQVDAANNPIGNWQNLGTRNYTRKQITAFSEVITFDLPGYKRWRIRAANTSPAQSSDKPPKERMVLQKIDYVPVDISVEIVQPGHPVTIFPDNVVTSDEVSGQELLAPNKEGFTGVVGPYNTNPPGTVTNRILLDFVFNQGLGQYDNSNNIVNFTVSWRIEYCRIDDFGNIISGWATLDAPSATMATNTPQRMTKTYHVPNGRYMIRVVRISETILSGVALFDSLVWSSMKAMLPGTYEYPITCIALAIKASNTLTQNASRQFSAIVTRKLPLYNRQTKTWSAEVPTRSWAAAISHVCKCEWGGRLKDYNIDLDTLWAIDAKLQAKNWFYDSCIDGPYLVWTLLCEMCQSQCVIPRLVGPILSFVQDAANRAPSFALTPRNIVRNTFSLSYMTWNDSTPDDVVMEYLDAAFGFQQRDVKAKLPDSESKEPSSMNVLGITDRNHAHKVAVAYAAHNRWQRVAVECQVEALGRIINKGDICTVAHPRFKNTASGAVEWWDESGLVIGIKQDMNTFGDTSGQDIYIAFTRQNGSIWGPCKLKIFSENEVILDQADYSTLLLQGQGNPFEWLTSGADRMPTNWTLYKARTYQRLMIVDSVSAQDMLHYNLKLLNYDSRIYQYGNLPVPPWQGRSQLPNMSNITPPENFSGIVNSSDSIILRWSNVPSAQSYEVQISEDNETWRSLGNTSINQISARVSPGKVFARVRGISSTMQGGWALWSGNTLLKPPLAPVIALEGSYQGGEAVIVWNEVENANNYVISLVHNGNTFYHVNVSGNRFEVTPEIQEGGPYRQMACNMIAVGEGGSSPLSSLTINDPAPVAPQTADIEIIGDSVKLNSVSPAPSGDFTGYILIEGANQNFSTSQVLEMRQTKSLPYTWTNLDAGKHYFRIAIKDAFFDITKNLMELNWSAVLTVEIIEDTE